MNYKYCLYLLSLELLTKLKRVKNLVTRSLLDICMGLSAIFGWSVSKILPRAWSPILSWLHSIGIIITRGINGTKKYFSESKAQIPELGMQLQCRDNVTIQLLIIELCLYLRRGFFLFFLILEALLRWRVVVVAS